ncbi:MAG: DUF4233 domain-containing protein [Actinomycetota bacterium]|nr:DUF4233 domain-containing protein [Actinomycetota bacterium]MDQ2958471.1 DUF4233 domain-containing protein [Actinomycetota bacterium]
MTDPIEQAVPESDPGGQPAPGLGPDPADLAERARRADRATRGGLAALLCLEAFVVLLVPRAIAQTSSGLSGGKTFLLVALAVVLVMCGFLLRRPWGIGAGSVLQLVLIATVLLIPAFIVVVIFFLLIWWYLLRTRHQLVGTPAGWRMLVS